MMDRQDGRLSLQELKQNILQGNAARVAAQHAAGMNTARERIMKLFDAGSFAELDAFKTAGNAVCGYGCVADRPVYCFAQDKASLGGAMGKAQAEKIIKVLELAAKTGAPVVALLDSEGAKLDEGMDAMNSYAAVLACMARLSGVCPMIACVMGPCQGAAALISQAADLTILVKKTGKLAVHSALVTGKALEAEELAAQGCVSLIAENEADAIAKIQRLLDLLPGCNLEDAPLCDGEDLNRLVNGADAGDIGTLLGELADDGQILELYAGFGRSVRTVLCRIGGRSAGVIANDYAIDGGRMDIAGCEKTARFVRFCDCFGLQIVTLVNTDGLSIENPANQGKLMRSAAGVACAYAEATAPKLAVLIGHAVGSAYIALSGKSMADVCLAWPDAFVSALTAEAAVQVLCDEQLNAGGDREKLQATYLKSCDAIAAAQKGIADDVIEAQDTRKALIAAMEMLSSKRDVTLPKKHGNMPL